MHGSIVLAKQMVEEHNLKYTYPFSVQFFTDFFGYMAMHGAVEYLGTVMGWFKALSSYHKNNKYTTGEHGLLLVNYIRGTYRGVTRVTHRLTLCHQISKLSAQCPQR